MISARSITQRKKEAGKADRKYRGWGGRGILEAAAAEEGMTGRQRAGGGRGVSQGQVQGKSIPGRGRANILGWDVPGEEWRWGRRGGRSREAQPGGWGGQVTEATSCSASQGTGRSLAFALGEKGPWAPLRQRKDKGSLWLLGREEREAGQKLG